MLFRRTTCGKIKVGEKYKSMFIENSAIYQSQNAYFHLQEIQISPLEVTSGFLSQINNYYSADKETIVPSLWGFIFSVS